MPVGALIGGGITAAGSLGASYISANAAKDASKAQTAAAQQALDFQKQVYANNQQTLSPWINTGSSALYSLAGLYGLPTPGNPNGGGTNAAFDAFTKLPAYQFPLEQGSLALERQLNAQGRTQSGAQARETQQFGQGLASTYMMQNYVNPLMSIAGQGQSAAGALAGYNNQSANMVGQSYGNIGTAQAAGAIGQGNAWAGGLNNATNSLAMYSALAYGGNKGGGSGTYALSGDSGAWGQGNPGYAGSAFYGPISPS